MCVLFFKYSFEHALQNFHKVKGNHKFTIKNHQNGYRMLYDFLMALFWMCFMENKSIGMQSKNKWVSTLKCNIIPKNQ